MHRATYQMSSEILRYGQPIRIRSYELMNSFLTSKSYTDQNIYFQIYHNEEKFLAGNSEIINITNYREALFEVLPTSSFEINDEMYSHKSPAKRADCLPRAHTEAEQFKAMIAEKRGNYISFGDKVVMRHLDSQYYLTGSFDCASSGIGAFKIELRKELSEKIVFQLISYRTYEKDGDQVSIYAPFRLYHCQTQCYVSYCLESVFIDHHETRKRKETKEVKKVSFRQPSSDEFRDGDKVIESDEEGVRKDVIGPYVKQFSLAQMAEDSDEEEGESLPLRGRYLVLTENIPKRVFKFCVHNQFEMKPNKVYIHNRDIVYFIHTKDDKYLCPDNYSTNVFLKKRKADSDLNDIFDGLWEVEEIATDDDQHDDLRPRSARFKGPSDTGDNFKRQGVFLDGKDEDSRLNKVHLTESANLGLTKLVSKAPIKKTKKEGDRRKIKYILRHLSSGRVLYCCNERAELRDYCFQEPILMESNYPTQEEKLVQFTFRSFLYGKAVNYYLDVVDQTRLVRDSQNADRVGEERRVKMDEIEETYESYFEKEPLSLTTTASEHGFRIHKASQEVKQLAMMVLSTQELLFKFTDLIENYSSIEELLEQMQSSLLNNVIHVLKSCVGFIYDCEYANIAESGNNPNAKKQRIFDQMGMIELITSMLEQIHQSDLEPHLRQPVSFNENPIFSMQLDDDLSGKKVTFGLPQISIKDIRGAKLPKGTLKSMLELNRQSEYKKVRLIYQLGYEVLESMAASNYLLKIRISMYLEVYMEHLLYQQNKSVYKSVQEVLDGNELALEKKIKQTYIERLIQSFEITQPDPADLYFLSRLCICGGKTVIKNQNAVFYNFYSGSEGGFKDSCLQGTDQHALPHNKFRFREDQQKMQILSKIANYPPQFRTLSELYRECEMQRAEGQSGAHKGHWAYFFQYLNLLADVCVQRNPPPLTYVQTRLPLKTLVAFLHEDIIKQKLMFQPFIRLVHHAFIEHSMHEEINRITKVKEWSSLGQFNIPHSKEPVGPELRKTMLLVMGYISRINMLPFELSTKPEILEDGLNGKSIEEPVTIEFDPENMETLKNVQTFLEVLRSTLNLGFWSSMEEMKQIVPFVLNILKFDVEYAEREVMRASKNGGREGERASVFGRVKQQLKLNKPNIVLLVKCKILAAEILSIIIDYECNVRVSIITKHFKDVMEMDVDLSKYSFDKAEFVSRWRDNAEYDAFSPANQKEGYLLHQGLWTDKVAQIIQQRDLFGDQSLQHILVLFETFVYSNIELTNLSLQLLYRITHQKEQILKTFKDIIFVAGGHLSKLATNSVETTRSVLLTLTSPTIKQMKIDSAINTLWNITRENEANMGTKSLGAIQELAALTMSMISTHVNSKEASQFYSAVNLYPYYDILGEAELVGHDGSYLIITEKDLNMELNQSLIKSQDHHLLIVQFIRIMSNLPKDNPLPIRALHAAYNFLTVLIWNHRENKKELEGVLEVGLSHMGVNVGCIDFFREMYTNNKKLVKKHDIVPIVHMVINHANRQLTSTYLKSKLLDFLRVVVIFDNRGYDVNQNIVMEIISQVQVSSNNEIVYLGAEQEKMNCLSFNITISLDSWIKEYQRDYATSVLDYSPLYISPQLTYIATFFEIFSALIENQNVVNIGKASNMHPLAFLLKVLAQASNCWMIVRHLRAYINRLYYFERRERDTVLFEAFTNTDLGIIRAELRGIAELICNTSEYNTIRLVNPIRYAYLGSYIFLCLQEILHSLDLMFSHSEFTKYIGVVLSQSQTPQYALNHTILQIIEMLEYLLKTIDGREINVYLARVSKHVKATVINTPYEGVHHYSELSKNQTIKNIAEHKVRGDDIPFKKSYTFHQEKGFWRHFIDWNSFKEQELNRERDMSKVQKRQEPPANESKEGEKQRVREYLLDLIFLGNIDKKIQKKKAIKPKANLREEKRQDMVSSTAHLPKNLTTSQSNRFKVKNERFDHPEIKNRVINSRRKKLVKFIEIDEYFRGFYDQEVEETLYDMFASLDRRSEALYGLPAVGNADVIYSIVKMNEVNPSSILPDYKLLIISMLINYIQRENETFKPEMQHWVLTEEAVESIRPAQQYLFKCGCARFLSSLIIYDMRQSLKMSQSVLMLGVMLLIGKNTNIQDEVFQLTSKDAKNTLLTELNELIKNCGGTMASHQNSQDQIIPFSSNSKLNVINYSDTFDFYMDSEKIMTRRFTYIPETTAEQKEFEEKVTTMQYTFVLLRNLCESNDLIRNYIRQQVKPDEEKKPKANSINFLAVSVAQLRRMFSSFNLKIVKVPFAIIDFVNQLVQIPCIDNQLFLANTSYFHDFAQLQVSISAGIQAETIKDTSENISTIFRLFSSNVQIAISCLQGNVMQIYELLSTQDLCRYFISVLFFEVRYLHMLKKLPRKIQSVRDLEIALKEDQLHSEFVLYLFQVASIFLKLKSKISTPQFTKKVDHYLQKTGMLEYYQLLEKNLLGIEIQMDAYSQVSDRNQTLFFPRHNVFSYLSRQTRALIMEEVNRSTDRDKIIGLLATTPAINEQIDYNYYLGNHYKLFGMNFPISNANIQQSNNLGLQIAALICLLMLPLATVEYYEQIEYDLGSFSLLFRGLSYLQFAFALLFFFLWTKSHIPLAIKQCERVSDRCTLPTICKLPYIYELYCLLNFDNETGSLLFFMMGSSLGTFYMIQWFSLLLISLLMARLDVLGDIVKALKASLSSLWLLALFGASFIGVFSIFSLESYVDAIYPGQLPEDTCSSVLDCIAELYIREQIGNDMESFNLARFIFDTIYVIFMDLMFGNIVGGVLIDTFAELRTQREAILKDRVQKCFICGIDKETLEKKNEDLKTHYTQQRHKLWNYVFYLYHLRAQPKKTGLELIIWQKYENEDVGWIPSVNQESDELQDLLAELKESLKEQKKAVKALQASQ